MRITLTNAILIAIVLAVVLGLAANLTSTRVTDPETGVQSVDLPAWADLLMPVAGLFGQIFLRAIRMLVAPLILTAIVAGLVTVPVGSGLARLCAKTFIYYGATMSLAVLLGLVLVNVIRPGEGKTMDSMRAELGAALEQAETTRQSIERQEDRPQTLGDLVDSLVRQCLTNPFEALADANVLGIITFAFLLGVLLPRMGPLGVRLIDLFESGYELMIRLVYVLLWLAPPGAFGLLFLLLAPVGLRLFVPLGSYCATVTLGLAIHSCVTLPLLLLIFGRMNPLRFFRGYREALAVALSTSSSSATLPVSMRCIQTNLGVPTQFASLVLPLGATVNMNGTALYEAVAVMFVAQVYGESLSMYQQFIIFITATFAAIGAASIPSAGLVTMFMVFAAVGIDPAGIALIITVDRVLDMLRTVVNVADDGVGAVIIARSEGVPLQPQQPEPGSP